MDGNAVSIKVKYEDGTTKDIKKGIVAEFDGDTMHMDMVNFVRLDLVRLTYGMLSALEQMGLTDALMAFTQGVALPSDEEEY
jgi:hypothetical protein